MKIKDRGYWVSTLFKYQSLWYWLWYSIYFRSITFFSSANPSVHLGGMLDDKKSDIYKLVNPRYLPLTLSIKEPYGDVMTKMKKVGLNFPVIVKPDVGYKGFLVRRIDNISEMQSVIGEFGCREMLIQEFVDFDHEFSVMCYFKKDIGHYKISSLVEKHLPFVIGDGKKTLSQLIAETASPFLKKDWINNKMSPRQNEVPEMGVRVVIDHAGNYARGCSFENLNRHIDSSLERMVNDFFENIEGINFGRLDVKAKSLDDLKACNFKLLEINGVKSEPIHIYDPKMTFWAIFKDIRFHWRTLFQIVRENINQTAQPSSSEGLKSYWSLKKSVG